MTFSAVPDAVGGASESGVLDADAVLSMSPSQLNEYLAELAAPSSADGQSPAGRVRCALRRRQVRRMVSMLTPAGGALSVPRVLATLCVLDGHWLATHTTSITGLSWSGEQWLPMPQIRPAPAGKLFDRRGLALGLKERQHIRAVAQETSALDLVALASMARTGGSVAGTRQQMVCRT